MNRELFPWAYNCTQGCGEVPIFVVYTERHGEYHHYHDGARHAVTRDRREGGGDEMVAQGQGEGGAHGPQVR